MYKKCSLRLKFMCSVATAVLKVLPVQSILIIKMFRHSFLSAATLLRLNCFPQPMIKAMSVFVSDDICNTVLSKLSKEDRALVEMSTKNLILKHEKAMVEREKDLKICQVKYELLEKTTGKLYWEKLERAELVEMRSYIDYFDKNNLDGSITPRKARFESFFRNKEDKINEWGLSIDTFIRTLPGLFDKLNRSAHPVFKSTDMFIFSKGALELNEIKMVGIMWEIQLLPPENLYVRDDQGYEKKIFNLFEMYKPGF